MNPILYDLTAGVATITLNRPEVMNALSGSLRRALLEAIRRAESEARVIVLTGAGRAFCSGQDLADAQGFGAEVPFEQLLNEEYVPLLNAIYDCPLPTIAAVNGAAAGAGANLALAADVVIAAESASFVQAFSRIGLIPDAGGTFSLTRILGEPRAKALALTAEPLPAEKAADWGLIWKAIDDADLMAEAVALASSLAAGPTLGLGLTKRLIQAAATTSLDEQLDLERDCQRTAGRSADYAEGVTAFLEKRKPEFRGQ